MADTHAVVKRIALAISVVLAPALALVIVGCSQSTAHPTPLGDCNVQGCNPEQGMPVGIQDAQITIGPGSTRSDGGTSDAAQDSGADAQQVKDSSITD